jgi:hypothetical protein
VNELRFYITGGKTMAKTIKFNLRCDDKPIRTIEELRENFSIEDVLAYHRNGLLRRWLMVRGFEKELKEVEALSAESDIDLIKELIKIFGVEIDPRAIEEDVYILTYAEERKLLLEKYIKSEYQVSLILDNYHGDYLRLIREIFQNPHDLPKQKAAIREIDANYRNLYELDYRALFYKFLKDVPMAIFVMLMNDNMRTKYLPSQENVWQEESDEDKEGMYKDLKAIIATPEKINEIFGENVKTFSGVTDGYWKDIEKAGRKYMILFMESGNFVRSQGITDGDLAFADVDKKFPILDGIDYKSNYATHKLMYVEV